MSADAETTTRGRPPSTTRELVASVALELFETKGFDQTTMDDVAAQLGVGRRTVFRYFPSKNDMVWGDFDLVLARLREDLEGQSETVSIIDAVAAAAVSSNRYPAEQLPQLRTRMILITTVPALQAHSMLRYASWREVIAAYAAGRRGESSDALWPQALAFAALGASMAAFSSWVASGGDLEAHVSGAYAALTSGFADA